MAFIATVNWEEELETIKNIIQTTKRPTYKSIGDHYGVTRERIRQVSHMYDFNTLLKNKKLTVQRNKKELLKNKQQDKWGNKKEIDPVLYSAYREKYRMKRHGAKAKGILFTITFGELIFPEYCPVLGITIDYFTNTRSENSLSWDRLDPSKGYISGNVCLMSWRANRIKNDGTKEEHQKIVDFLSKIEGKAP